MPSELIVSVENVKEVIKHPNADRLDIIKVKGWYCIVWKDSLKVDDLVVYIPIDSVLPEKLETIIFHDSKIKLKNSRVRTEKIRNYYSQGLAVPLKKLIIHYPNLAFIKSDERINDIFGITKYEPTTNFSTKGGKQKPIREVNPNFKRYIDINHLNNYPDVFQPDDVIIVTEKIHGTNARAGYVPLHDFVWWKRWFKIIKSKFDKKNFKYPGYEFVFGSHNVQLQEKSKFNKKINSNFSRKKNVYEEIVEKYDLRNVLKPNESIYYEIYGDGVQKKYSYGLKNKIDMVVFDYMIDGKYRDDIKITEFCYLNRLPIVPLIRIGEIKNMNLNDLCKGNSVLCPNQKIREGIVIRGIEEKSSHVGRHVFKLISPDYLAQKDIDKIDDDKHHELEINEEE